MSLKLLVRQGGGAASEPDLADPDGREGVAIFDRDAPLLQLGQRWEQGTSAMGYFKFVDPTAASGYVFRPHASVKLTEDASGTEYILAWHRIGGGWDVSRRGVFIGGDEIEQDVQSMDCNMDLRGLPFEGGWSRPAETSWERLQALADAKLSGSGSTAPIHRSTTNITVDRFTNDHLVDATDPVDLEAYDYPEGTFVEEVLDHIMGEWGKGWGVTLHHEDGVGTHRCLLVQDYDDLAKFTSDVKISDQIADYAPADPSEPVFEPFWLQGPGKQTDNDAVISGLISIYGGLDEEPRTLTVETGEAPEDWEVWWDVYHDDVSHTLAPATRRATTILNDRKRPYTSNQPSIVMAADQTHLITAGQAIQVKSVVLNQDALKHSYTWRRIVNIIWEPRIDGRWWAHLELDRPRNSHPVGGGGGAQPGSTSPKPAPECALDTPGSVISEITDLGIWPGTLATGDGFTGQYRYTGASGGHTSPFSVSPGGYGITMVLGGSSHNYTGYVRVTDSTNTLPGITTYIVNNVRVPGGHGDVTEYSLSFDVPTGYDTVRFYLGGKMGGWRYQATFSTAPTPADNDPDCIPPGTGGTSPYYARTDDSRFDADDQHLITRLSQRVVNNSGGDLDAGDVVIPDTTYDGAGVTTTTTASLTAAMVGVLLQDIADGEEGVVLWQGVVNVVNDGASTSADGDYLYTSTTAGAAAVSGSRTTGAVGRVVRDDAGDPEYVLWWGVPDAGGGGSVATDTIWDAKGDLAAGTGANTAAKLTVGTNDTILMADSAQSTGLKWVASQTPSTQAFGDAAAEGTADTYSRGDHKHAMPANPVSGLVQNIEFVIDGGGAAIATGIKGDLVIDFACTVVGWTLLADQSCSATVDVWKDTYTNFPPTNADSIVGSEKPTITTSSKGQDLTLTTWSSSGAISAGDILRFNVDTNDTAQRLTLALKITR